MNSKFIQTLLKYLSPIFIHCPALYSQPNQVDKISFSYSNQPTSATLATHFTINRRNINTKSLKLVTVDDFFRVFFCRYMASHFLKTENICLIRTPLINNQWPTAIPSLYTLNICICIAIIL